MSALISKLEGMLALGKDSALLRYSLGAEYFKAKSYDDALRHLDKALALSPHHSATWKLFAKVLVGAERVEEGMRAYQQGIDVALLQGDLQAAKEMRVFLRRLEKNAS